MTSAVIYARISKDDRGEHLGVDRQERLCRELAARDGLTVGEVLVDNDFSAYSGKRRPGFERLMAMMEAGEASAVIAYHADRLYRRTTDLERLVNVVEQARTQVHTVAAGNVDLTTASGRMVARMLGAAAQHESERMGERLRAKSDEMAAKGSAPGGRSPFGYQGRSGAALRAGKGYVIEPGEAAAVRFMADRVLQGASLLAVARELDARGTTTREGRPWHHSSVRATLVNPAVAGLRVHRGEIAGPGDWEPVLERKTWEAVCAVLADPARKRTRPAQRYLLSGLVTNPNGDPMTARPDRGAGGRARRCYATRHPASPSLSVGADGLEELVVEMVLAALDDAVLPVQEAREEPGVDVERLEAELAEIAVLRGNGDISLAEWMAARQPLLDRIEAAKAAAGTSRRPGPNAQLLTQPGAVRLAWPTLDFAARREIIAAVVARVTVMPATRGRWTQLEERVEVVWRG